jgi:glucosamine--fructose-6-phosphate aminotransferase (isomerizing)
LHSLREKLAEIDSLAPIGIGHTRWATHGKPEEYNAHPHLDNSGRVAVVQNGIVENYRELRKELKAKGHKFVSDTDTEVIPHLIAEFLQEATSKKQEEKDKKVEKVADFSFLKTVLKAVNKLEGAFAIAVICADFPEEIIVARQQAPLVIGFGAGEFFCASDTPALVSHSFVLGKWRIGKANSDGSRSLQLCRGKAQKKPAHPWLESGFSRKTRLQTLHAQGDL